MASEQGSADWGCVLPAILVLAAAVWWWNDRSKEAPPPIITPTAPAVVPSPKPASSVPAPETKSKAPEHNYSFVEGDVYGYIAAVSEEDRKQGKAAGDVVQYRYAGYWEDEYHLELLNSAGDIIGVDTCRRPCVAIKQYYGGRMERLAYNPQSIVGAAFEDVFNGQLKVKRRKAVPAPRQSKEAAPVEQSTPQASEQPQSNAMTSASE